VLLAYGAEVTLSGPSGSRVVPLADFFLAPGRTAKLGTEIVQSIDLPVAAASVGTAFGRITRRFGVDLATVNLCCHTTAEGEVRFAFGAVGPRPFVVLQHIGAVQMTESGGWKNHAIAQAIGEAAPISDVRGSREYRLAMLEVLSRRTLDTALARLVAR
jgi:carbon-monoxide dehydrogenase medium subunit